MKLLRYGSAGSERPGIVDGSGVVRDLSAVVNDITGFVTMTMEGALLKVSADEPEAALTAGQPLEVRVKAARVTARS